MSHMSHIIAVTNQKGGTGKTTTVANLAGTLTELGKHVLVVDIDPQSSLSIGFNIDVYNLKREKSLYAVLAGDIPLQDILVSVREHIDIAPTNIYLSAAELQLVGEMRREDRLKNALAPIKDNYDFVLIDCPPSLGLLNINALSAATHVLIPMSCDYYAMMGVRLLLNTIKRTQAQLNPDLAVLGVLPTRYDRRTAHAQEVLAETREKLGTQIRVFDTVIRETVRFKETPIRGEMITEYDTTHPGADDYRNLAKEVIDELSK